MYWRTNWGDVFDYKYKINERKRINIPKLPSDRAFIIPTLSEKECKELIRRSEIIGYKDCGYPVHYRSNTRIITHDEELASKIFSRISKYFPKTIKNFDNCDWTISNCNPRFRFCKYIKGQRFKKHCDACYEGYIYFSCHLSFFYLIT